MTDYLFSNIKGKNEHTMIFFEPIIVIFLFPPSRAQWGKKNDIVTLFCNFEVMALE